ncbi:hypothetical protein VNO77_01020 [Canavalia gladiata]|uniref:GATA-type domain-containing protein n=1 Tax=Canavalia gladiata TaxID=3824 RepID=A0AAN9R5W2_CANGL
MVKKCGPCLHCGIQCKSSSYVTPLWRNGPEDKPVLCNACGSRYRIWGSLEDYFPKHFQPEDLNNLKNLKGKSNDNVEGNKSPSYDPDSGGKDPHLWQNKIPSKKRSWMVCKEITPMKRFQTQLLSMWKHHRKPNESSSKDILVFDNVNSFIPSNEIGLGAVSLKSYGNST